MQNTLGSGGLESGGKTPHYALTHVPTMCDGKELAYEEASNVFAPCVDLRRGRGVFARKSAGR